MRKAYVIPIVAICVLLAFALASFALRDAIFRMAMGPVMRGERSNERALVPAQELAGNLTVPWEIAVLPGGGLLVTERPGAIKLIRENGDAIDFAVPDVVAAGEGGLLGLALDPDFAENSRIYVYHTARTERGLENRIARFTLDEGGGALRERKIILAGIPAGNFHDGGRIAFGPDGMLYATTGDAGDEAAAQDRASLAGKILRMTKDGAVPQGNPFGNLAWSWGHRNPQGIAWDDRGRMWATEHGRSGISSGYDELNLIEPGRNYGWPEIQGDETKEGMTPPVRHSGPDDTWAPADIAFVNGELFFAGLRGNAVYSVRLGPNGAVGPVSRSYRGAYGRIRALAIRDGELIFGTSNQDGRGSPRMNDDRIFTVPLE